MNKIIVRIKGGIGNQLFSYAVARRLALVNDAELIIDDISGFSSDYLYQRSSQMECFHVPSRKATVFERLEPFPRLRYHLKRRINAQYAFERRKYIFQEGIDFDLRLLALEPKGTVYMEGYWQSEAYFKDIEATIRQDLKIKPPKDALNLNMASKIQDHLSVAVHVRYFDKPDEKSNFNLDRGYYTRAINLLEKSTTNAHYFVFTDDATDAANKIPLPKEKVTYVLHNKGDAHAYADLWLMTQCQHFIIANSTFSWWGAWLAEHINKQIIAPNVVIKQGKMCWGFDGLLPESWIKL